MNSRVVAGLLCCLPGLARSCLVARAVWSWGVSVSLGCFCFSTRAADALAHPLLVGPTVITVCSSHMPLLASTPPQISAITVLYIYRHVKPSPHLDLPPPSHRRYDITRIPCLRQFRSTSAVHALFPNQTTFAPSRTSHCIQR